MSKITLIKIFLLLFLFSGCESVNDFVYDGYNVTTLESISNSEFPQGVYYEYIFSSLEELIDPTVELESLVSKDIIVNHAWYRGSRRGCGSGSGTTNTMYKSVFLVCMLIDNQRIIDENYKTFSRSTKIPCGRNVMHFELK